MKRDVAHPENYEGDGLRWERRTLARELRGDEEHGTEEQEVRDREDEPTRGPARLTVGRVDEHA